jgi:hypothetical protein
MKEKCKCFKTCTSKATFLIQLTNTMHGKLRTLVKNTRILTKFNEKHVFCHKREGKLIKICIRLKSAKLGDLLQLYKI